MFGSNPGGSPPASTAVSMAVPPALVSCAGGLAIPIGIGGGAWVGTVIGPVKSPKLGTLPPFNGDQPASRAAGTNADEPYRVDLIEPAKIECRETRPRCSNCRRVTGPSA